VFLPFQDTPNKKAIKREKIAKISGIEDNKKAVSDKKP
jgi:hypothetical protein